MGIVIGTAVLLELLLVVRAGFKLHNLGLLDWQIEKSHELNDEESEILSDDEIIYNGEKYRLNDELITILVMGIDSQYYVKEVEGKNCGHQSDANFLLLLDGKKSEIRVIAISRDTITKLRTYDLKGEPLGYTRAQLALQYAYGDGGEGSCELSKEAVSHLMYGVPITLYTSINMGAVPSINNAVGGVKITAPIDVPSLWIKAGETVKLSSWQADRLLRSRDNEELGSNDDRMLLQKTYLMGYISTMKAAIKDDVTVAVDLYKTIKPYMSTDITQDELIYLANEAKDYSFDSKGFIKIPGESVEGSFHDEYIVDDAMLKELVIDNFYIKAEEE